MSVGTAWTTLGFDAREVILRIARLPRTQRVAGAKEALEKARVASKRLLSLHHPDKGGDSEMFKRVNEAIQSLTAHTEDFERKMAEVEKMDEERSSKHPYIKIGA
jgi:hypothetical protein